jgi:hypothetical protein
MPHDTPPPTPPAATSSRWKTIPIFISSTFRDAHAKTRSTDRRGLSGAGRVTGPPLPALNYLLLGVGTDTQVAECRPDENTNDRAKNGGSWTIPLIKWPAVRASSNLSPRVRLARWRLYSSCNLSSQWHPCEVKRFQLFWNRRRRGRPVYRPQEIRIGPDVSLVQCVPPLIGDIN